MRDLLYIVFGTVLVGGYATTVKNGLVFASIADKQVMPPEARALGPDGRPRYRTVPLFWGAGYHGGK